MKLVAVSNCDKGIIKDLNSVRIPRDERKNYLLQDTAPTCPSRGG